MTNEDIKVAFIKACEEAHANGIKVATDNFGICLDHSRENWAHLDTDSMCIIGSFLLGKKATESDPIKEVSNLLSLSYNDVWSLLDGFDGNEATMSNPYYPVGQEIRQELIAKGIMNGKGLSYLR